MKGLPLAARAFVWAILSLGVGVLLWSLPFLPDRREQWLTFGVLAGAAAVAQLFPVVTPKGHAYELTPVFVFAGLLLLPRGALALLIVLAFIPEWIRFRRPWHIQLLDVGNVLIDAFLASVLYFWLAGGSAGSLHAPASLLAAVAAAGLFAFLNHLILALVMCLAHGHSLRETRLFELDFFLTDGTLLCTGTIVALLWQVSPWLVVLTSAPLFLIYKALHTLSLQEQARTDAKTGLYNPRHFYEVVRQEFRRAARFNRPLAVIMADTDLLRSINNSYGHLAGDTVLKGVADVIRRGLREYDVAARFGGDEFAILLIECGASQGLMVAERLRKQVEDARFVVPTSVQPIQATLSLGVASFPAHGRNPDEVIHQADLAVYYAKLCGRNRSWACSPESMALGPTPATAEGLEAARRHSPTAEP